MKKIYGDRFIRRPYYRYLESEKAKGVVDVMELRRKLHNRWALPTFFLDDVMERWLRSQH